MKKRIIFIFLLLLLTSVSAQSFTSHATIEQDFCGKTLLVTLLIFPTCINLNPHIQINTF